MIDKLINPNKYIRITGGLLGGVLGYGHSYFIYNREYGIVPLKLQIPVTVSYGFIGYLVPILPFGIASSFTGIVFYLKGSEYYNKWEKRVVSEAREENMKNDVKES